LVYVTIGAVKFNESNSSSKLWPPPSTAMSPVAVAVTLRGMNSPDEAIELTERLLISPVECSRTRTQAAVSSSVSLLRNTAGLILTESLHINTLLEKLPESDVLN